MASKTTQRLKDALMFIPNLIALLGRLLTDSRVPIAEKALLAGAIVYAISPIDFIPDVIPFVGQIDDAYLIALTLLRLINRTDESVVRDNWRGGIDVVGLLGSLAALAPRLLPQRVSRVLSARVEVNKPAVNAARRTPIIITATDDEPRALRSARAAR